MFLLVHKDTFCNHLFHTNILMHLDKISKLYVHWSVTSQALINLTVQNQHRHYKIGKSFVCGGVLPQILRSGCHNWQINTYHYHKC